MVGAASREVVVSAVWIREKARPLGGTINACAACTMVTTDSSTVVKRVILGRRKFGGVADCRHVNSRR